MKYLVTGSSGHLGEGIVRTIQERQQQQAGGNAKQQDSYVSIDIKSSPFTTHVGSISEEDDVEKIFEDASSDGDDDGSIDVVFHTATLHKPHIATHSRQDFVHTNILGTQLLLDASIKYGVKAFVFTSTTSTFGKALIPSSKSTTTRTTSDDDDDDTAAVWVDENLTPIVKNIYGATKVAAETMCSLAHNEHGLNVIILRVSRFFLEEDDSKSEREEYPANDNMKLNELLNRRADMEDMVSAHFCAASCADKIGFGLYVITATTPFQRTDVKMLMKDPEAVVEKYYEREELDAVYKSRGWKFPSQIQRVYDNSKARRELVGWDPKYDFGSVLKRLMGGESMISELHKKVGKKTYHDDDTLSNHDRDDGPYPTS